MRVSNRNEERALHPVVAQALHPPSMSRRQMPCPKWELFFIQHGVKVSRQYWWDILHLHDH